MSLAGELKQHILTTQDSYTLAEVGEVKRLELKQKAREKSQEKVARQHEATATS